MHNYHKECSFLYIINVNPRKKCYINKHILYIIIYKCQFFNIIIYNYIYIYETFFFRNIIYYYYLLF